MSSRYMDNYDSDPNMQGDGPPMLVLGRVRKTGGATNRIIFDSTDHPDHARCRQLAALEQQIGRAVIANYIVNNSIWSLDKDWSFTRATNDAMNILNKCLIVEGAIVGLITRWRKLHAEGAETEAATERQEGER